MKRIFPAIFVILIFGGPLLVGATPIGAAARTAIRPIFSPLRRLFSAVSAGESDIEQTIIDKLTVENAALKVKETELAELTALIGFDPPPGARVVPANILGMNIDPERRLIYLDRGSSQGIRQGSAIIAASHWVIGTIFEVAETSSVGRLLVDAESRQSALLLVSPDTPLLVTGAYGTGAAVTLIPSHLAASPDAIVVTAGLEPAVPRGLPLGRISHEIPSREPPFQSRALIVAPELASLPRVAGIVIVAEP